MSPSNVGWSSVSSAAWMVLTNVDSVSRISRWFVPNASAMRRADGPSLSSCSSNVSVKVLIGVPEAFYTMRNQLQNHGDIVIPIFVGYALFFVVLTLPVGLFFGWLAKRWAVAR